MPKEKRISDISASSAGKNASETATATPPYSSEGPTLPIIGDHDAPHLHRGNGSRVSEDAMDDRSGKRRQMQAPGAAKTTMSQPRPPITVDPSLYKPWTLLPTELLRMLESQSRLRETQNIIPVVFTKNQNIKSGINKLKTYLGAYLDKSSPIDMPSALKQIDSVIAISAQGDGTAKLTGVVDMARRVVAPSVKDREGGAKTETWWLYASLTSVEVERKTKLEGGAKAGDENKDDSQDSQEEDAFEPIVVDGGRHDDGSQLPAFKKVPVLTVWMTRKRISAFKDVFGEQSFFVRSLPEDD
jgi:hypothetical protein